jgi:arginyl-tRNA synthetase
MFDQEQQLVESKIAEFCAANDMPFNGLKWSPIPFSGEWGIATSFFQLAADEAKAGKGKGAPVPQRANQIAEQVKAHLGSINGISRIEAVKAYVNLYFSTSEYAQRVIDTVIESGSKFGSGSLKHEQVMIEFSNPNTHKSFHVGHLRSAILGDALSNLIEFAGYDVVRSNYPGDMGLHVIKWLWAYLKYHNGEEPEHDITNWMGSIYSDATRKLEENPDLEAEVRAIYARWDKRDPEVVDLWKKTRQWSLEGFHQLYNALGIEFDTYYFNSGEEERGKVIVEELIQRGIATDERSTGGAVIVKIDELLGLTKDQYRTAVILRSDGTALYATEDLSLTLHKFADHPGLSKSIYVVDTRQSLHFTQVFKILEIAGYEEAKKCQHIAYEVVTLPGNVILSSREGNVVLLEDLLREANQRAYAVVKEKNPALTEDQMQAVAKAVGLGALKYPMLARDNTKIVTFDWQTALDFNGQAAPYIQYAHVRCNSIMRKAEVETFERSNVETFNYSLAPAEIQLIDLISRFPTEVQRAAAEYKPLIITSLAYEIAKAFNDFYNTCPVIQADEKIRNGRLRLVAAAKQTMANALALLGIQAPEVM